ncbi:MAG: DUF2281 domain-containing protein [bacterium]
MNDSSESLVQLVKKLPPHYQEEVRTFTKSLLSKAKPSKNKFLRQDWAGALKNYKNKYTSLQLQKKALGWRGD